VDVDAMTAEEIERRLDRAFKVWWHNAIGIITIREHQLTEKAYREGYRMRGVHDSPNHAELLERIEVLTSENALIKAENSLLRRRRHEGILD
jgi:hypothetical protein